MASCSLWSIMYSVLTMSKNLNFVLTNELICASTWDRKVYLKTFINILLSNSFHPSSFLSILPFFVLFFLSSFLSLNNNHNEMLHFRLFRLNYSDSDRLAERSSVALPSVHKKIEYSVKHFFLISHYWLIQNQSDWFIKCWTPSGSCNYAISITGY